MSYPCQSGSLHDFFLLNILIIFNYKVQNCHQMIQKSQLLIEQSIVKTQHSFMDIQTYKQPHDRSDNNEKIQQFRHVCQWINTKLTTINCMEDQNLKKQHGAFGYYLIKIDSINNLTFKRLYTQSKVFLQLICKLFNVKLQKQYSKICRVVRQLTEVNPFLFELKEPLCFYCYSSCETDILFKMEFLLSEQYVKDEIRIPMFGISENAGFIQIDFLKEKKTKDKKLIALPNQYSSIYKINNQNNVSSAFIYYYLHKSDSYRYLEKIIPQNVICDPTDRIPGIVGYHLPLSQNTLTQFAISSEAKGLLLNFIHIQFGQNVIKDAYSKAQMLTKQKYNILNKFHLNAGDIVLKIFFHNGWKIVSSGETIIRQKGQIHLKTNNSHIQQFQNPKKKNSQGVISQKKIKMPKAKQYSTENHIQLKLSFPQEEYCALILQIGINFQTKFQIEDKKQHTILINQELYMPLCFTIASAKALKNFKIINSTLYVGSCLNSFNNLKEMVIKKAKQVRSINHSKRHPHETSISKIRNHSLIEMQNIQNIQDIMKLNENISQVSFGKINDKDQLGFIQFEVQFIQSQDLGKMMEDNNSLLLQNFSSINISKVDIKDKIIHEKQRILRQAKKPILEKNKKLGIQFLKEIFLSQNLKQYPSNIQPKMKEGLFLHKKEEMINFFKQQINKSNYKTTFQRLLDYKKGGIVQYKKTMIQQNEKRFFNQNKLFFLKQQITKKLYMLELSQECTITEQLHEQVTKYLFLLYSNYSINSDNYYRYEEIPQQIIKTQLSEINFNNCYFLHFLQFNNINNQIIKLPKIFFFVVKFYNEKEIRSELMTVNKDTGQIFAYSSKENMKILHIQVDIDKEAQNYALNYIHFIEYLYNGLLNIEIIDYSTSLPYGNFYLPLRNLIRKRKNEVVIYFQDYVYHRSKVKAILKVQARAIRKMKNKNVKLQNKSTAKDPVPLIPLQFTQFPHNFQQIKQIKVNPTKNNKVQLQKHIQPTKTIQQNKIIPKSQQINSTNDRRLDRITKFKQNRYKKQSKIKNDLNVLIGQEQILDSIVKQEMLTQEQESAKITRLLHDKYLQEVKIMKVSYLKKEFIFLEIQNKYENQQAFNLVINDQDQKWLLYNPIKVSKELVIIKDVSFLDKEDINILHSVKKYQDMLIKSLKFDDEERISLQGRAKGYVLLCYQTLRRYRQQSPQITNDNLYTIYNHERIITCSLINELSQNIETIYSIQIVPMPEQSTIQLQYYRPANQQSAIHLPFINPGPLLVQTDYLFSNNPHLIISAANQQNQDSILEKFSFIQNSGIYIQIPNTLAYEQPLQFNILVFNNTKQKKKQLMQSRKTDNQKNKSKNAKNSRLQLYNDFKNVYGPKSISLQIKIWGCQKITLKGELWVEKQGIIQLRKNTFKNSKKNFQNFCLICDDEQCLTFFKNDKNKHEGHQVYKFTDNESKLDLHYSLFSQKLGSYYININAIDASHITQQKALLQKQIFKQIQPFHRLVVLVQNKIPGFKQILKININKSSQQLNIQEPFAYRSSLNKKMNFKILTSDEKIVWVKSSQINFTLQSKAEKKFDINFNIQKIIQKSMLTGSCESVIMGVKWAKGIDYFGFKFNIF